MTYDKIYWLLDERFDFLLDSFVREYSISKEDITFIGSYHGPGRAGCATIQVGEAERNHITLLEPEDINRRFMERIEPGKASLVVPFTGAYLPAQDWLSCPLTTGEVAVRFNRKWDQYQFFQKIGIPTPETVLMHNPVFFQQKVNECLKRWDRLVVKHQELSGGYQMHLISHLQAFEDYLKKVGQVEELLVSEYIPHSQSFAGTGFIAKDGSVSWCAATEQVLYHDFAYEGLIFPPFASDEQIKEIRDLTVKVGKGLAKEHYRGFYNVDFIASSQGMIAVEINARFGFGTLLFACNLDSKFWKLVMEDEKQDVTIQPPNSKRLLLGKIKGREGRRYSNLKGDSNILNWYQNKEGSFRTYFFGTEEPEWFDYGSYIGLFGTVLSQEETRENALKVFWGECLSQFQSLSDERKLLYMYIEDYWDFHKTGFNFDLNKRFAVKTRGEKLELVESNDELRENGWEKTRFFGENISSMTLLIGENGSGKTTLMRKLISWLCVLAEGEMPKDRGLLVFQAAEQIKYICFGGLEISSDCDVQEIKKKEEAQELLSSITFAYYTDTMTDWGMGHQFDEVTAKHLKDWSLLGQLSDRLVWGLSDDISNSEYRRSLLRRTGFIHQMRYLLAVDPEQYIARDRVAERAFPLHYLKLHLSIPLQQTVKEQEEDDRSLPVLMREMDEIMCNRELFSYQLLIISIVSGYSRALQMLLNDAESRDRLTILAFIYDSLLYFIQQAQIERNRQMMESQPGSSFLAKTAADLVSNLRDYVRAALDPNLDWWNKKRDPFEKENQAILAYLDSIMRLLESGFFELFRAEEPEQKEKADSYERIWIAASEDLIGEEMRQERELILSFFEGYDRVSHLTANCWFEWLYPSSGELNSCNLYAAIKAEVQQRGSIKNGVWIFCDEPDNAFHPRWKRQTINELLAACCSDSTYVQLWIATHSPIMLSDVPDQAAILLKKPNNTEPNTKMVVKQANGLFAQQIYALFQDAFFLENGAIGQFAEKKLKEVFDDSGASDSHVMKEKCKRLLDCVKEPLLRGYLSELLKLIGRNQ